MLISEIFLSDNDTKYRDLLVQKAQLPQRDRATRYAMLVTSCYVTRGMGARKVSNSNSDLRCHSRALAMV